MAKFVVGDGYSLDMSDFDLSVLFQGKPTVETKSRYVLDFGNSTVDFRGTGFKYEKDGTPRGGEVHKITARFDGDAVGTISALDVSVKSLVKAASTASTKDDLALLAKMLAKKDTILGADDDDVINGFKGNDTIYGAGGADELTGGGGSDRFIYKSAADSTGTARDTIIGFEKGDKLDLSALGDLSFVGNSAAPGVREVAFTTSAGNTIVHADVDGNGAVDLSIALNGIFALAEQDFILL